jgi:hypothetical protein
MHYLRNQDLHAAQVADRLLREAEEKLAVVA